MFINFTPHKVKIKETDIVCDVVAMDIEKRSIDQEPKIILQPIIPKGSQENTIEYDKQDDENEAIEEGETKTKSSIDIIIVWILVINSGKYEWYNNSQVEPLI